MALPSYQNGFCVSPNHVLYCASICRGRVCLPLYACMSRVQYLLPGYLARGAVCCLNKGSQSPALKRTFIKHFHSLHLFPLATADRLGRLRCHIALCALPNCFSGGFFACILFLMLPTLTPHDDHQRSCVNKSDSQQITHFKPRCNSGGGAFFFEKVFKALPSFVVDICLNSLEGGFTRSQRFDTAVSFNSRQRFRSHPPSATPRPC